MSTTVKQVRSLADIVTQVGSQLNLADNRRLTIALATVAEQEIRRSRDFAQRVRDAYEAMPSSRARTKTLTAFDVNLVPIKHIQGRELDPAAPLDPYFLNEVYGPAQLSTALSIFPVAKLKEGAAAVERRNPGTRPTNRAQRQSLIDYITHYVAGV